MSPPSQAAPVVPEDADMPTGRCLERCAVKLKAPRRLRLSRRWRDTSTAQCQHGDVPLRRRVNHSFHLPEYLFRPMIRVEHREPHATEADLRGAEAADLGPARQAQPPAAPD